MSYSAKAVANTVIEMAAQRGMRDLSPMKLQKLLFYIQSWYVKLYEQPLFDDPIERWDYGPVIRDVYNEFKTFGSSPVTSFATDALGYKPSIQDHDTTAKALIHRIFDVYGKFSAIQLSNMTHAPESAWSRGDLNTTINFEDLKTGRV